MQTICRARRTGLPTSPSRILLRADRAGGVDQNLENNSLHIPLPDHSVAVWHCHLSLETLPPQVSLPAFFAELARVCGENARLIIDARHPSHDSFVDDDRCVRAITLNKLQAALRTAAQSGSSWWQLLTQLVIDPEFLPVIKDMAPAQRNFELRTRRNAIKQTHQVVLVNSHQPEAQFVSCYADVPSVPPFAFSVYRDWKRDQYLSPEIVLTGQWEPQETHLFVSLVRGLERAGSPLNFFNVGGNFGWYSALILNVSAKAHVTAFEPVSSNFELLTRNTAPHAARTTLHHCALSNETGEASFYIDAGNYGGCSLVERPEGYAAEEKVQLHTFDELYANNVPTCDFMVMDIEGAEHKFFDGARATFEGGFKPIMMLEYCPSLLKLQGSDGTFVNTLAQWGYHLYIIDRANGALRTARPEEFLQHYARLVNSEAYLNYMAVPEGCDLATLLAGSGITIDGVTA